jgi:SSS family solute:Na+ symporter
MAADSMSAARRTPLIAAVPKMLFPFLVVVPGIIALGLTLHPNPGTAPLLPTLADGTYDYNMALPLMISRYYPAGLLGLGLTALLASLMSGMAGNVTAFNTVWTFDIYQSYIRPRQSDAHYLWMGRMATVFGVLVSRATAYAAMRFNNIMDMLQLVFSFVNAPLFATFLLGMFWKRTTGHGAFWGLVAGTGAAALHYELTNVGGFIASAQDRSHVFVSVGHGAELLGCHRRVDHLLRCHGRNQPGDDREGR